LKRRHNRIVNRSIFLIFLFSFIILFFLFAFISTYTPSQPIVLHMGHRVTLDVPQFCADFLHSCGLSVSAERIVFLAVIAVSAIAIALLSFWIRYNRRMTLE